MSESIKPKNNVYLDSTGIAHNREILSTILNNCKVYDKGTNSNGSYIRYDNGIMICWHKLRLSANESNFNRAYGSVYYNGSSTTWTYPKEFKSGTYPVAIGTAFFQGGLGGFCNASNPSNKLANGYLYYSQAYDFGSGGTVDNRVGIDFIAIGFWK